MLIGQNEVLGLLLLLTVLLFPLLVEVCLHVGHILLQSLLILLGDDLLRIRVLHVPRQREQVCGVIYTLLLEFLTAYLCAHQIEGLPTDCAPQILNPSRVTQSDALRLPEYDIVQEFTTRYSDFAHELLIEVVSGYAFFGFLLPFFSLSSPRGSSVGRW